MPITATGGRRFLRVASSAALLASSLARASAASAALALSPASFDGFLDGSFDGFSNLAAGGATSPWPAASCLLSVTVSVMASRSVNIVAGAGKGAGNLTELIGTDYKMG